MFGEFKGTPIGNYLESANYADVQFGMFIDELKKAGLYDNTVLFIFGDHYGMRKEEESLYTFLEKENNIYLNDTQKTLKFTNVLAGIHIPGMKKGVIDKPVSKLDIKPTILSIAGIESENDICLGRSIFSTKDYASTNEYTIITKDMYYDSRKWVYIDTNEDVNMDSLDEETKKKLEEMISNLDIELGISNAYPILYKIDSNSSLSSGNSVNSENVVLEQSN